MIFLAKKVRLILDKNKLHKKSIKKVKKVVD